MRAVLLGALTLLGLLTLPPTPAEAHDAGSTLVTIVPGHHDVTLTAQIPLSRIDFAYHTRLDRDPQRSVTGARTWLTGLVRDRVQLTDPSGAGWSITVGSVTADHLQGFNTARVELTATPPAGGIAQTADLRWGVVTEKVYTHKVFIGDGPAELTGLISRQHPVLRIPITAAAAQPVSFATMLSIGFEHFREGADHLLFLCMVGLTAARRRARPPAIIRQLALLTGTFTIGHSLSLATATLGWITPPSQWVETGIAMTIGVTAVHAIRPTLPAHAELAVTGMFGLIHGFGFAGTLHELSMTGTEIIEPLLGFNLGLEAAQLLALGLLALPLWIVARSTVASAALAAVAAAVAACWILQRAWDLGNPLEPLATALLSTPERLSAALFAVAVTVLINDTRIHRGQGAQRNR